MLKAHITEDAQNLFNVEMLANGKILKTFTGLADRNVAYDTALDYGSKLGTVPKFEFFRDPEATEGFPQKDTPMANVKVIRLNSVEEFLEVLDQLEKEHREKHDTNLRAQYDTAVKEETADEPQHKDCPLMPVVNTLLELLADVLDDLEETKAHILQEIGSLGCLDNPDK